MAAVTVPVVWYSDKPAIIPRGYWDEGLLEGLFDGSVWRAPGLPAFTHQSSFDNLPAGSGAVVVIPARWHVDRVADINDRLAGLPWALVVLCGDEEGVFPAERLLHHPNLRLWVQTPHQGPRGNVAHRRLGDGWPPALPAALADCAEVAATRPVGWFFAGQINNGRRDECLQALSSRRDSVHDGILKVTRVFGSGLPYGEYVQNMACAKVVPAPSGTFSPDTFRLFEALEAGCVPVADSWAPKTRNELGYWQYLFDGDVPFPVVERWRDVGRVVERVCARWPEDANRCGSWWAQKKREMAWWLVDDLAALGGIDPPTEPADLITVLMPTSSIPEHPSLDTIAKTLGTVRDQLGDCEIVVMVDGLRDEQADRRKAYREYVRRLIWTCQREWHNVVPVVFDDHQHQAEMTRHCLGMVRTPNVLFVEHDTPLCGPIDWPGLCRAVAGGGANVIRLHHESEILEPHRHLMLDDDPIDVAGVPLRRTVQWSQRPHLATTDTYRDLIGTFFGSGCRTMIEDTMYGVVHAWWRRDGNRGWERFRLWMYTPTGGSIQRSYHLDGRGADPMYPMMWTYDGPTPFGAPNPRDDRVSATADAAEPGPGACPCVE